jgi:hypothetical protein
MFGPISIFLALAPIVIGLSHSGIKNSADDRATLITTLGSDTVVLESYTRTASRLDGDMVIRLPGTVLVHYVINLDRRGVPSSSVVEITPLGTLSVPRRRVAIDFTGPLAAVTVDSGGIQRRRSVLTTQAIPEFMTGFGPSYGLYESPVMYALYAPLMHAAEGDTVRLTALDIGSGTLRKRVFVRRSPTLLDADFFGMAWTHVAIDGSGRVTAVDAGETTERTQTRRADYVNAEAAAQRYAAADHSGKGLGNASPAMVARSTVGDATVAIAYGSPRRRDRTILGHVVPYGTVWRTGANEATTLSSDRSLSIGGVTIPAGVHSVWTLPDSDGSVDLIINGRHGQWGTDYDSTSDVARIPMKVATVTSLQENFAMAIGGKPVELSIAWGNFVWSLPVTAVR